MRAGLILASVILTAIAVLSGGNSFAATTKSSGSASKAAGKAHATLESKSGSTVTGKADFVEKSGGVEISVEISGATPGMHGVHLHQNADCSAADASSAGGHFNPDNAQHGAPDAASHHGGDLGNITIGANGKGKLKIFVKGLTVAAGDHSVVGRSVVVHADPDDLKSQPAGNSGKRVACGAITGM